MRDLIIRSMVMGNETDTSFSEDQRRAVRGLVRRLPELEQWVVYMRFWDSWPMHEIAEFLEISVIEAEQTLERALKRLRVLCLVSPAFQIHQPVAA